MDNSIKLGPWRIGLDALIGLIPGVGDLTGAAVSTLIVGRAVMSGIPRATVFRMVANLAVDTIIGAIPVLGDLFDFGFKANTRNLNLYRQALATRRSGERDWTLLIVFFLLLALVLAVPILAVIWLVQNVKLF